MQYVGTVLNHVLREELKQELTVDPALVHIMSGGGLAPEDITPDLIMLVRNVVEQVEDPDGPYPEWTGRRPDSVMKERCHASEE